MDGWMDVRKAGTWAASCASWASTAVRACTKYCCCCFSISVFSKTATVVLSVDCVSASDALVVLLRANIHRHADTQTDTMHTDTHKNHNTDRQTQETRF